jgi:hypothetical protein
MSGLDKETQKEVVRNLIANEIKDAIKYCQETYPDAEVHSIMVYGHTNMTISPETQYAISLDVKDRGQIHFGLIQ